jgi:anti-sigma regulatory factor (Ser/Thr protein kinase)
MGRASDEARAEDAERHRPPSPTAAGWLLSREFDGSEIARLRREIAVCAGGTGLAGQRLADLVLAVNELATNAVRHGGGSGRLRLWLTDGRLVCEVIDSGGGIAPALRGRNRPDPEVAGGWGLWLARELSDGMTVLTGPDGTSVQISTDVPPKPAAAPDATTSSD